MDELHNTQATLVARTLGKGKEKEVIEDSDIEELDGQPSSKSLGLTPIDPPILAVGTGVIATDNDIEMDKAESAPVGHVVVSVCASLL